MTRLDGSSIFSGGMLTIPAKRSSTFDACSQDSANQYGVITVEAVDNRLIGTVHREGTGDQYRFPTQLKAINAIFSG